MCFAACKSHRNIPNGPPRYLRTRANDHVNICIRKAGEEREKKVGRLLFSPESTFQTCYLLGHEKDKGGEIVQKMATRTKVLEQHHKINASRENRADSSPKEISSTSGRRVSRFLSGWQGSFE